jgi:DNA invertase Pin-like site-specific DNA recombinase
MLSGMRDQEFSHVVAYHPDRLMRQPRDLEELLQIADDRQITLHVQANQRDLSDPNDRFILRIEVAHACRSSYDTSQRLRDEIQDRARARKPHTGVRHYRYTTDGRTVIEGSRWRPAGR